MWEKEREAFQAGKRIQYCPLPRISSVGWIACPEPAFSTGPDIGSYRIHPDDDKQESNMELKVGDRVVRNDLRDNTYDYCVGYTGTVVQINSHGVRWDEHKGYAGPSDFHHIPAKYLSKVVSADSKEVQAALKLLKQVGKVEFTPYKPAFKPISVRLNSHHTANVSDKNVTVGCQTFTFDAIDQLAAAVKQARDYNNS